MTRRHKIALRTVGCRANQADTAALLRALDDALFETVDDAADADVVVVNTCCVTQEAERDCRKIAYRAQREAPRAVVAVVGCAVRAFPGFAEGLGERVVARSADDPRDLAAWLAAIAPQKSERRDGAGSGRGPAAGAGRHPQKRTRALLKVQSGCSHGCAYCIVPRARGVERSVPLADSVDAATRLAAEGAREIVLTGVQLGAWGCDLVGRPRLPALVAAIADAVAPGRVRLSSVEPWSVDDALIDVVASHPRVCPHLHIPLQSGDDRILGLMRRGYDLATFEAKIGAARGRIADLALGTDVLCGFPTETDAEHARTLDAVARLGFTYVHAFPYSPRPGTDAATMGSAPGRDAAKRRVLEVRELGDRAERAFLASQRGAVREAIVEESRGGVARGLTDNFIAVEIAETAPTTGSLVEVVLGERAEGGALRAHWGRS